jgi:hypothetical protein
VFTGDLQRVLRATGNRAVECHHPAGITPKRDENQLLVAGEGVAVDAIEVFQLNRGWTVESSHGYS